VGAEGLATVAVVPRERFSMAVRSLRSVLRETPREVPVVYVDGGSPPDVARRLARVADGRPVEWVRSREYLAPNRARNLALARVRTRYVAFVDNDVLVAPGWLDRLVERAEASGAWVVGPLYLIGPPGDAVVHTAGGEAGVVGTDGRRGMFERQRFANRPYAEVRELLAAGPTGFAEFHAMLVRRDVFDRLGPLDERLTVFAEHIDLSLAVRAAGGAVEIEPASIVTYVPPPPFASTDLPFFAARWSAASARETARRLAEKWDLSPDDPFLRHNVEFCDARRRSWLHAATLGRLLPKGPRRRLRAALDAVATPALLGLFGRRANGVASGAAGVRSTAL
jgi:glycosyltransferase involved in cell wall biosynthesis